MQLYISGAIASILLPLTLAAPDGTPANLVPRACTTNAPATIYRLDSSRPNDPITTSETSISRSGPPYQNTNSTVLVFSSFPNGATGCQLKFSLPRANTPAATSNPDYSSALQGDLYLVKSGRPPTYNTPPFKDQMVATIQFPTTRATSDFETILWSGNCPTNNVPANGPYASQLTFMVEASTWQQLSGQARVPQQYGVPGATVGFTVIYNC